MGGGAFVGAGIGIAAPGFVVDAAPTDGDVGRALYLLAVAAGFAAGYAVGRATFAVVFGRAPDGSWRSRDLAGLLLATPAYFVAGVIAAAMDATIAGLAPDDLPSVLPATLGILAVAWLVAAPLALAFAPSRSGRPRVMHRQLAGCAGIMWVGVFAAIWIIGSMFVTGIALVIFRALVPEAWDAVSEAWIVVVAGWLAIWIGGTVACYLLVRHLISTSP